MRSARETAKGMLRVVLLLLAVGSVMIFTSLRSAEARMGESLMGFGDEISRWQEARPHSKPRQLTVNGLELRLLTASTELGIASTLDHFEGLCDENGIIEPPVALQSEVEHGPLSERGVLRHEAGPEGVLACVAGATATNLDELTARLREFASDGELSALGELRYVYARRTETTTTVLVIWTEGEAKLLDLFPSSGDAPGRDPQGVSRVPGSRRTLSAIEHGKPYSVTVYETPSKSAAEVRVWYERSLRLDGWELVDEGSQAGFVARRRDRTILFSLSTSRDGKTMVALAELS